MRLVPLVLLLAACSPEAGQEAPAQDQLFAGTGRDRLCVKGERIGIIAYGAGVANCALRGRVSRSGEQLLIITPDGDEDCRIGLVQQGDTIRLGKAGAACAYYCGPGASFEGKAFTRSASASPAIDFAGDPLC